MRARMLIGLLVIGAATALLVGAIAQFTSSSTGTGSVGAASVEIEVVNVDDTNCSNLGHNDSCTVTAEVNYIGTVNADVTVDAALDNEAPPGCFSITGGSWDGNALGDTQLNVIPGSTFAVSVDVTLDAAGVGDSNDCQGATADVDITADAVQS